jgi:amphi-Trp domain-containing protein
VTFKSTTELTTVVRHLEEIVSCLKAGKVSIGSGDQSVTLTPESPAKMAIEAVQKADREALTIKLAWRREEAIEPEADLRIGS